MTTSKAAPPLQTELEVSLFGPGYGECVVVHLGYDRWMVVDSCLDEGRERSIAATYLEGLGVDLKEQVKLIVVSHWHDDHIRGVAKLVEECRSARFACSAALHCKEFFKLVACDRELLTIASTSGVSEFADVFEVLKARTSSIGNRGPDFWANESMQLYRDTVHNSAVVSALSPSAQSITNAITSFLPLLPQDNHARTRIPKLTPNEASIVLSISNTNRSVLLGADLERGSNAYCGWQAVLASAGSMGYAHAAYKVAHHGSEGADDPGIWNRLLSPAPYALVTPYNRGSRSLPACRDVARIKNRTNDAYCTAWPIDKTPPRRHPAVDKTLKEGGGYRSAIRKRPGHIRLRIPFGNGNPTIDLFDGAQKL